MKKWNKSSDEWEIAVLDDLAERVQKERAQEWNRRMKEWEPFANPLGLIRMILLVDWDPIRVFGVPTAMDEYDDYADKVYALLVSGASQEELVAYLRGFSKDGKRGRLDLAWEVDFQTVAAKLRHAFDTCRELTEM